MRTVLIEPQPLYRSALEAACAQSAALDVVGRCSHGRPGLAAVRAARPDVVVMDLELPDIRGIALLEALGAVAPDARVVILTANRDGASVYAALAAGAIGYICKHEDEDTICAAISAAARGDSVISASLQRAVAVEIRLHATAAAIQLTPRERDVIALVAQGCSTPEIGRRLYVSPTTVKTHLRSIYDKLGVSDRAAAVAQALKRGLLDAA